MNKLPVTGFFIIGISLIVAACTPQYVKPSSKTVAEIRFRATDNHYFAMIHTYEKPACVDPQAIGLIGGPYYVKAEGGPERLRANMIGSKGKRTSQIIETIIKAEQPFTVLYSQIGPHDSKLVRTCNLPITFKPKAGEQYEVLYQYDTKRCYGTVSRLGQDQNGRVTYSPVENVVKERAACSPYRF